MHTNQAAVVAATARLMLAALFLIAGVFKLLDPAGTQQYIAAVGLPFPLLSYLGAVGVEVGLGLALLVGYRVRLVAAVMALFTLATALLFHANLADANQLNHFLKNVSIAGGLLLLTSFGAGALSLDSRRARA